MSDEWTVDGRTFTDPDRLVDYLSDTGRYTEFTDLLTGGEDDA